MSLKDIRRNPLMLTDCYNLSHQRLKVNTDWEVSHFYNRAAPMVLYGFREMVGQVLNIRITAEMVKEAEAHAARLGLKFPTELFMRVVNECMGYLPLKVEALDEGTWCPAGTPFAQISNTEAGFGELITWWEAPLMHAYFASACATEAFHMRRYLESLVPTYGEAIRLKFHSFGFRGHKSLEDAYWAGTAWNLFLMGTDDFHTAAHTPTAPIGSIAALAHKVTQQYDDEIDCFYHAIDATADAGEKIVAMVIDTYDAHNVITHYVPHLARYAKVKGINLVFRPDSGDTYNQAQRIYQQAVKYKLDNISCIIGEAMSFARAKEIDGFCGKFKIPLSFISYGVGAGFYKHIDRDTLGWAMKTAYSNGADRMKFGEGLLKRSIPGIVSVVGQDGNLVVECGQVYPGNLLKVVYSWSTKQDDTPDVAFPNWEETRQRALSYLSNQNLQQEIEFSQELQDKIESFRTRYLTTDRGELENNAVRE